MPFCAALFRGVNVSGKNRVEMPRLHDLFIHLGYTNVETYVQSGNVIFSTEETGAESGKKIRNGVEKEFGIDVPVLVVPTDILGRINNENPFLKEGRDPSHLHFTFVVAATGSHEPGWDAPSPAIIAKLDSIAEKSGEDTYRISPFGLYILCPNGYGRTKLSNNTLERTLKSVATTRNWKTTAVLLGKCDPKRS